MKRPSSQDDYVQKNAGARMLERIRASNPEYVEDMGGAYPDEEETIALLGRIQRYESDGYELAKELEREGWDVDSDLVDTLNGGTMDEAIDELTAQWIMAENIRPKFSVGMKGSFTGQALKPGVKFARSSRDLEVKTAEGEITKIDMKRGTYTVTVEAFGQQRGYGYIKQWEQLEAEWSATPVESN